MALILADRVKVRSTSTGTGSILLANTVLGFQSFEAVGDGNETFYGIIDNQGNWEIGRGTYTASSSTLSRDNVISSSNNNTLVNFAPGGKNVFGTFPSSLAQSIVGDSVSDRLVNSLNEFVLEDDGSITLPTLSTIDWDLRTLTGPTLQMGNDPTVNEVVITGPAPTNDFSSARRLIIQGQQGFGGESNNKGEGGDVYIWAGAGGESGAIDPRGDGGDVKLRAGSGGSNGGYIRLESGDAQAENGNGGFLDLNAGNANNTNGYGGSVNIRAGYGAGANQSGDVNVTTNNGTWTFAQGGTFQFPNYAKQSDTSNVICSPGVDTVIYTGSDQNLQTFKLLLKVEGWETTDTGPWDTQSSEMIIARGFRNNLVVASVYGVVHTSTDPLATFTAQWNPTSSRVEVFCRPTSPTYEVIVRTFATEITTSD